MRERILFTETCVWCRDDELGICCWIYLYLTYSALLCPKQTDRQHRTPTRTVRRIRVRARALTHAVAPRGSAKHHHLDPSIPPYRAAAELDHSTALHRSTRAIYPRTHQLVSGHSSEMLLSPSPALNRFRVARDNVMKLLERGRGWRGGA
jgi:hypothetical protein